MKKITVALIILISFIMFLGCDSVTTTATTEHTTTQSPTTTEAITTTNVPTTQTTTSQTTNTTISTLSYTGIEVTQNKRFYRIGESFDASSVQVTASFSDGSTESIDSNMISVRGFNSSSIGSKTVYIIFQQFLVEIEVYILEEYAIEIDMPYYEEALNLQGNLLKIKLNNIINENFNPLLYGDARDILQESDEDPSNPSNIMLVYTGWSVDSTWDSGATWNREHVWPQSRLGVSVSYTNDYPSKATDIHNLKPADPNENALRSNDYFGTTTGNDFYEPRDEVKGDIARILFYMATMYSDLSLDDDEQTLSGYKTMGTLSLLLEWNTMDPVDEFEMNRNNILFSYQGNRNPFIDYPEFADLIWGTTE